MYALTVYNGELISGGTFTTAGDVPCNKIARWNGSAWQPLGTGMGASYPNSPCVYALTVYNGGLIAGGYFDTAGSLGANCIARWDGTSWQPLGTGMNSSVHALTVYNGALIAGGYFTTAGGVSANYIARWNSPSWQPLGTGMAGATGLYPYPDVQALTVYDGELIAGGNFTTAGGNISRYWARWSCPHGACCFADGHCEIQTQIDCTAAGASYKGDATMCAPSPCLCPGDMNCDGSVTFADIDLFVEALSGESAWNQNHPTCPWLNADCNHSGTVTFADIDPFVAVIGTTCQ